MKRLTVCVALALALSAGFLAVRGAARPASELSRASSEELLGVYKELRQLHPGAQWAVTENAVWKRDAGTFTFAKGRFIFAAPVQGRVLAAVFDGDGTFELAPPTAIDRGQISRFSKGPKFSEPFHHAVFFFTDDSLAVLQKEINIRSEGAPQVSADVFASVQKRYAERFNRWWENQVRGSVSMHNLAARMLADLSDPTSSGLLLADMETVNADNLLFHISWNRDLLLPAGFSSDEEIALIHYKGIEYWEWWAGFHLAAEYAKSPHPEHRALLAHCPQENIDAEISKDNRLSATAEMDVQVPAGSVRLLSLNLANVLRISSVTDATGNKLAFIQESRELDSDPWVLLPAPAAPNQTYKLRIAYAEDSTADSRIVHQEGSGLYYVGARTSWFPSFGAFDDRTNFKLNFRSPKKFTFLGTGRATKTNKDKEVLETEWTSEIPLGVAGFNYGDFVSSSQTDTKLTVTAYNGKDIPDDLKSLRAAITTAELSEGSGHRSNLGELFGIQAGGFNTARMVGYAAEVSFKAFKLGEAYFGSLPFKTVSVTEQPVIRFGQSWPNLIFLPYDALLDAGTRHGLRLQGSQEEADFYNLVAVHEMAHQWWGHVVGWKTYHDQWLSEGIAEFFSGLYLRKSEPGKWAAFTEMEKKYLLNKSREGSRWVDVGPLWLNYQLNTHVAPETSQFLIYKKGAYVLEMLRSMMEDPGAPDPDLHFIAMMKDFVTSYSGKNASTEDFRRVVEKHMGEPMGWFFDEWVYGIQVPNYQFQYELSDAGGGKTNIVMNITQSGVSDSFTMRVPVYVTVKGRSIRLGLMSVQGNRKVTEKLTLPVRPEKVTLDENRSILCTMQQ